MVYLRGCNKICNGSFPQSKYENWLYSKGNMTEIGHHSFKSYDFERGKQYRDNTNKGSNRTYRRHAGFPKQ